MLMRRHVHVLRVLAWLIMGFSLAFLVPAAWTLVDARYRQAEIWLLAGAGTAACGALLWAATRRFRRELSVKDGFLLVNLVWTVLPGFAAAPLLLTVPGISVTDAYFEAMSGLTATGATALAGLDLLDPAVNMWRCFLQLIGGLGIMLLAVAVLPFLGLGGMQLFKAEMPGPMKDTRLTPRIAETARGLWGVYFVLSLACMLAYRWGGMSWDDAFMHMCTTVGLGGLSSHDQSFGYWNSPALEWLAVLFMALSGISFARYFMVWRTRSVRPLWRDAEVRAYVVVLLVSVAAVWLLLLREGKHVDAGHALRDAAFQVVSVATTTGYATTDYLLWPTIGPVLMLLLGAIVSCAGSTGGGIKMVRTLLLIMQSWRELARMLHPNAVIPIRLGGQVIPNKVVFSVLAFMSLYGASIMVMTMMLLFTGLDLISAFTAVVACITSTGPGLNQVGPATTYESLSDIQIWILSLAMLLGRLEIFTVMVIFTPAFWRK